MKVFGTEHIVFMIVSVIVLTALLIVLKKFVPQNKVGLVMKITAFCGLVLIVINRIVVSKSRNADFIDFLPDTYCSMMGLILPLTVLLFKPTTKIYQYAVFAGFIGGLITFFYPDFFVYFDDFFNIHPFTGILYHTLMVFIFAESLVLKYFTPSFRKWTAFPIGLAFMVVYACFGNSVLGQTNNMYLNAPLLPDTILSWWFTGIMLILLYTLILQIYEIITLPVGEWTAVKGIKCIKSRFCSKKAKSDDEKISSNE